MQIDIAESLLASWLRHERKCQIVQTNWKAICWDARIRVIKERINVAEEIINRVNKSFTINNLPLFGNQKIKQILKQVEIDAIGCEWNSDGKLKKIIAGDVAFHSKRLNYSSGKRRLSNAEIVVSKLVRTLVAVYIFWGKVNTEVFFASPCVAASTEAEIEKDLVKLRDCIMNNGHEDKKLDLRVEIKLYLNKNFHGDIKEKVHLAVNLGKTNSSELYARSYHLYSTSYDAFGKHLSQNEQETNEDSIKIGRYVQQQFIPYLEKICSVETQSQRIIQELTEWELLKNCPVVKQIDEINDEENRRYYVTPVRLSKKDYRVCNHWFAHNKESLENWMKSKRRAGEQPTESKE